jgi:hypothetical protein
MPATLSGLGLEGEKRSTSRASNGRAALLIGGFGLLLLLVSGGTLLLDHLYRTQGREVIATVTGNDAAYDSSHFGHANIHYEFSAGGRVIRGNQSNYSGRAGESVLVVYLPSDPSFNRVSGSDRQEQKALGPVAVAGCLFLLIAIQASFRRTRDSSKPLSPLSGSRT